MVRCAIMFVNEFVVVIMESPAEVVVLDEDVGKVFIARDLEFLVTRSPHVNW